VTLRTALEQGTRLLEDGAVGGPKLTAEVLLAHALQRDRVYLIAHPDEELSEIGWIHYGRYLHQRLQGNPTQYITRRQEFYGREFRVTPDVLIPRPETEHVVAAALERLQPGAHVLDVGTGSGAIAVTLALESRARVLAADISVGALRIARHNAAALRARVEFVRADVLEPFASSSLDMVVSNPPYVGLYEASGLQREVREHEPHIALFAGEDGNIIYERLTAQAERVLCAGGWLILELGYRSLGPVRNMLGSGWEDIEDLADLAGLPRVLVARWRA
jgi:release factor glutamine methyltransferase